VTLREAQFSPHSFRSGTEFLDALDQLSPGCVLLDLHMPDLDGLQVQDQLMARRQDVPLIFMTGDGDVPTAVRAIKKGAVDYIEKPFADEQIIRMIDQVLLKLGIEVRNRERHVEAAAKMSRLTTREIEVMRGLLGGNANKAVAYDLNLSTRTVEMHRANIMKKIGVRSFAVAVQIMLDAGLAPLDSDNPSAGG
jgi:two-component system response regulator FixJ